jgi:hypothetical protein
MKKSILLFSVILLAACGSSGPTIAISSPNAGATVPLGTDAMKSVSVSFSTTGFTLMAPGATNCPTGTCGHVHLFIDGSGCTPAGAPYNNDGVTSPVSAYFIACQTPTGSHTVSVELHNNDHTPVTDSSGKTIAGSVTFTTQ